MCNTILEKICSIVLLTTMLLYQHDNIKELYKLFLIDPYALCYKIIQSLSVAQETI